MASLWFVAMLVAPQMLSMWQRSRRVGLAAINTVRLLGRDGGKLFKPVDRSIIAPAVETARI